MAHLFFAMLAPLVADAWSPALARTARLAERARRVHADPQACICINCKWIDRCEVYHWVETQHEQPHVTMAPDFDPDDPQGELRQRTSPRPVCPFACALILCLCFASAVQVFIRNEGDEVTEMSNQPDAGAHVPQQVATGVRASVLTTEYDVFGCASFDEDAGKWVRLMPEAGFIPT